MKSKLPRKKSRKESFVDYFLEMDKIECGGENSLTGYIQLAVANLRKPREIKQFYNELIEYIRKDDPKIEDPKTSADLNIDWHLGGKDEETNRMWREVVKDARPADILVDLMYNPRHSPTTLKGKLVDGF